MSLVKFCGLFREEDIKYANILKPDYVGFVFADSRRKISVEQGRHFKSMLDKNIKTAGVFLNNSVDEITNICSMNIIDVVQLHGNISEEFICTIKSKTNLEVICAANITKVEDILSLEKSKADYVLLDSEKAGSGRQFDYELLNNALKNGFKREYFMAGGININNIHEVLKYKPYCIDISSGIEKDGVKNYYLMEEIIKRIKGVYQ